VKFLLDHDVPEPVFDILIREHYQAVRLREVLPITTIDRAVFAFAIENRFTLISCNQDDFLDLAASSTHAGLVILIRRASRKEECSALLRLIKKATEQGLRSNVNFA
jgi:predicted nuclease of predicted toxin-antitoxin system